MADKKVIYVCKRCGRTTPIGYCPEGPCPMEEKRSIAAIAWEDFKTYSAAAFWGAVLFFVIAGLFAALR